MTAGGQPPPPRVHLGTARAAEGEVHVTLVLDAARIDVAMGPAATARFMGFLAEALARLAAPRASSGP